MPVQPISTTTIRSQLDAAVHDGTLTNQRLPQIISQMKTDGVSKYEANEVLEALRSLVGSDGGAPVERVAKRFPVFLMHSKTRQ